jgi:hypothetical protein
MNFESSESFTPTTGTDARVARPLVDMTNPGEMQQISWTAANDNSQVIQDGYLEFSNPFAPDDQAPPAVATTAEQSPTPATEGTGAGVPDTAPASDSTGDVPSVGNPTGDSPVIAYDAAPPPAHWVETDMGNGMTMFTPVTSGQGNSPLNDATVGDSTSYSNNPADPPPVDDSGEGIAYNDLGNQGYVPTVELPAADTTTQATDGAVIASDDWGQRNIQPIAPDLYTTRGISISGSGAQQYPDGPSNAGQDSSGTSASSAPLPNVYPDANRLSSTNSAGGDNQPWTYLVDLGATIRVGNDNLGAPHQYSELQNLRDLTSGTQDQVIVQASNGTNNEISMYRIANGQIEDLGVHASEGFKTDLQSLVSMAPQDGHAALIIGSHGEAGLGLAGDNGAASLTEVSASVESGLQMSGRTKALDVLSLDSCLMGSEKALESLSPLAQTLVASEAVENGGSSPKTGTFDGQSIYDALSSVLQNPQADGQGVAQQILFESAKDCPVNASKCGTDTLAIFDGAAGAKFSTALSNFGTELQSAISNSSNRDAVNSIISSTPEVSHSLNAVGDDQLRDLQTFVTSVQKAADAGTIDDPDHRLRDAAAQLVAAQAEYIPDQFNNQSANRDGSNPDNGLHGLSIFLPSDTYDRNQTAKYEEQVAAPLVDGYTTALKDLSNNLSQAAADLTSDSPLKQKDGQTEYSDAIDRFKGAQNLNSPSSLAQVESLAKAIATADDGTDLATRAANIANLASQTAQQLQSDRDSVIHDEAKAGLDDLYQKQGDLPNSTGWNDFLNTLRPADQSQQDLSAPTPPSSALESESPSDTTDSSSTTNANSYNANSSPVDTLNPSGESSNDSSTSSPDYSNESASSPDSTADLNSSNIIGDAWSSDWNPYASTDSTTSSDVFGDASWDDSYYSWQNSTADLGSSGFDSSFYDDFSSWDMNSSFVDTGSSSWTTSWDTSNITYEGFVPGFGFYGSSDPWFGVA